MRYLTLSILLLISLFARSQSTYTVWDTVGNSITRVKIVTKTLSEMPDSLLAKFGSVSVKVAKTSFYPTAWTAVTGKPSFATVATSGSYADLSNRPTTTSFLSNSTDKNFVSDAKLTVLNNTAGSNNGDNAVNSLYSGLVSNATHTGDATGSTALTVVKINGVLMSGLGTGILKNTTGTGVPSIAVAGDFPTLNQNTSGTAAGLSANIAESQVTNLVSDLAAKQATLVSATNIKTVNGSSLLGSGDIPISGTAAWGSVTGTMSNQSDLTTALSAKLADNTDFIAYQALGSPFLAETVGTPIQTANTSTALVDGQIKFTAVYLAKAATITGVRVYVRTLGSYTPDNNNRVGLYSYSGGVLTLVASSANSGSLWTSAANAFQTIAFSGTYSASVGIYFVGILYNNSAQVTAPTIGTGVALNNLAMATLGFTNSAKLYGTANGTDLTTPINMSAITGSVIPTWVALY